MAYQQAFLDEMKKRLTEEKQELEKRLGKFASKDEHSKDNYDANFPDRGDESDENAQEVAEYSRDLGVEKVLEKQLHKVNAALEKLDDGTYGVSPDGGEVSVERLEANPAAGACLDEE